MYIQLPKTNSEKTALSKGTPASKLELFVEVRASCWLKRDAKNPTKIKERV